MYRNKKLLELANNAEHCLGCGRSNGGDVVAAHSNQLRDGKGRGIKAQDYRVAYLCFVCHKWLDESGASRAEKLEFWEDAHRKTIGWLFDTGHLKVV